MSAECVWWQHPQNDCPGSPAEITDNGDCAYPSCNVAEFYQQVAVLRAGMIPSWFGIGFPEDKETLETLLSDEIKAVMDDPQYNQISEALSFDYYETMENSNK